MIQGKHITIIFLAILIAYFTEIGPFKRKRQSIEVTEVIDDVYDYVIVGSGSAGSVLAARLSEDKSSKVLLLEAGGHYDENPLFDIPLFVPMFFHTEHDWDYTTEPQTQAGHGVNKQKLTWPRGRVLGGTSVINSMQYTRGSKFDFDQWENNGCSGWGYSDVLPYFLKFEDIQIDTLASSKYHGTGGPIAVSAGKSTPLADVYIKAGQEMGYNSNPDYNGADQEGLSPIQLTIRNGVRSSTSIEYLSNKSDRKNLHIALRSLVSKVDIQNKTAVGVFYVRNGKQYHVSANKEVIVSAGVVNSPQLLMLSGIGPKEHLEEFGIPVIADLPVGQNMQDHPAVFMFSKINEPISMTQDAIVAWTNRAMYDYFGKGLLASPGVDGSGYFYLDPSKRGTVSPDIQFAFLSGFSNANYMNLKDDLAAEYLADGPNVHGFGTVIMITKPRSKGVVKLRSGNPFDYPIIDLQYLADKGDMADLIGGIRIWEKFMQTPSMKQIGADINLTKLSICSDFEFSSDAYWECFLRYMTVSASHQTSTCKMGGEKDPSAVLDPQLRVKGITGLRVVDASVFPNVTSGNTNAPVIMVAEKAADMIRRR